MKLKTFAFLGLLIVYCFAYANTENKTEITSQDIPNNSMDSLVNSNKVNALETITLSKSELISILEDRNTTVNYLSIFITALGVLFTVMAIVAAIVIYMQSKDFKNKLSEATDKYKLIINQFIESKREDLKNQEEDLTKLITEYREKLEATEPEKISEIKEIISELESKKEIIEKRLNNSVVTADYAIPDYYPSGMNQYATNKYHKCSQCGFGFLEREPGYLESAMYINVPSYGSIGSKVLTCPKCGNVDKI